MISENMVDALNAQITKEFYSAYLYLSMAAYFDKVGLFGFANWMRVQTREEIDHGMIIYEYLIDRRSKVELQAIDAPEHDFKDAMDIFLKSFDHEKEVTASINTIAAMAEQEPDRATKVLMNWFLKEQVEEENSVHDVIERLKLFGDDCTSLYLMDKEMAERKYEAPSYNPD